MARDDLARLLAQESRSPVSGTAKSAPQKTAGDDKDAHREDATKRSPLFDQILDLDPLLAQLEGATNALTGVCDSEVSSDCEVGAAWLSAEVRRLAR